MYVPLFTIGLSMLWTELLISLTGLNFCAALCAASLLVFLFFRFKQHPVTSKDLVFASVFIACILFLLKTGISYNPAVKTAEAFSGEKVRVNGRIVDILKKSDSGNRRYIVEVESMVCEDEGEPYKVDLPLGGMKLMLSSKYFRGEINDYISFDSKLYVLGEEKSLQNYYKSKGYYVGAYVYEDADRTSFEEVSNEVSMFSKMQAGVRSCLFEIREYTRLKLKKYLPDNYAGVTLGMLIGDKSEIPEEFSDNFTKTGIVHLFSVSGFHMSLWSEAVYKRLLKSGFGKRISSLLAIVFILFFTAVTGFSMSTVRAGIMMGIFFLGRMIYMDSDSLNSLGLSACVITLANPFCAGDVGFLLSFFSTLGIVVGAKRLMRPVHMYLRRINNYELREQVAGVISGVAVSLCAFVFTFPFVSLFIGDVSLTAPLTNLLTGAAASTVVFLSGIGVLLSTLPLVRMLCYPIFLAAGLLLKYIAFVTSLLARVPYTYVGADTQFVTVAVAAVFVLCAAALLLPLSERDVAEGRTRGRTDADGLPHHKPAPIAFGEIYSYYGYRARLVFWLSVIIIMSGILAHLCSNFLLFIV